MSVPVGLDRLREEVTTFGSASYLLTVTTDQRPHAVSVIVEWVDDELAANVGARTAANADERTGVTLLWSPVEPGGYSLIVDGSARASMSSDGHRVVVRPTKAVLHRSRPTPGPAASDCVPVLPG